MRSVATEFSGSHIFANYKTRFSTRNRGRLVDPQIIRIERNRTVVVDASGTKPPISDSSSRVTDPSANGGGRREPRRSTAQKFHSKSFEFEEATTAPQERGRERAVVNPAADRKFVDCGEAPRGTSPRRRSFRSLISYGASFRDENCKGWTGDEQITQVVVTYKGLRPPCCRPEREKA